MLFALLQERLVAHIRERVRAGELTERSLARLTGMSQPHMHNVLKGVRSLSTSYADQILGHLHLSASDLLSAAELGVATRFGERSPTADIPRLRGAVGPFRVFDPTPYPGEVYPISRPIAEPLTNPVLVTLAHDPLLFPHFQEGDLALVTRPVITPGTLENSALYLVQTGNGSLVRSLRATGTRLYLVTPETSEEPRRWEYLSIRGDDFANFVKGRLVWIARHLPPEPLRPPTLAFLPSP